MYLKKKAEEDPTYHPLLLTTLTTLKDEQVEHLESQMLTDALRCSDAGNTDLEQVSPPLDAVRLAAGQTLYRLMNNRLGTLQMMWSINPGSEGMTDHSTGWLMLHHSRT